MAINYETMRQAMHAAIDKDQTEPPEIKAIWHAGVDMMLDASNDVRRIADALERIAQQATEDAYNREHPR